MLNFQLISGEAPNESLLMPGQLADLGRIDLRILDVPQQDGRFSNLRLADTVALSPTAELARVQRLPRAGFILGYEAGAGLKASSMTVCGISASIAA